MNRKTFDSLTGLRIVACREAIGYPQARLARVIGISQSAFSRIESGETTISTYDLIKVSYLLNVPTAKLLPYIREPK